LFAAHAYMLMDLLVLYTIFKVTRLSLSISKSAIKVYIINSLGFFTSMVAVYWGSQFLLAGLSPIVTGVLSNVLYRQKSFSVMKLIGIVFGLVGLMTIFGYSHEFNDDAAWGIIAIVVSTITHALSEVMIKHINASLTGVEATYGELIVAVPLFLTSILISNEPISLEVPVVAWIAILYLGMVATALGFSMYYFILKNMDAIKVSMMTLVTPVTALLLGALFNNEPLSISILMGALLVGLCLNLIKTYLG
jgi:drug/metabolite transporter (DMT)-like permease